MFPDRRFAGWILSLCLIHWGLINSKHTAKLNVSDESWSSVSLDCMHFLKSLGGWTLHRDRRVQLPFRRKWCRRCGDRHPGAAQALCLQSRCECDRRGTAISENVSPYQIRSNSKPSRGLRWEAACCLWLSFLGRNDLSESFTMYCRIFSHFTDVFPSFPQLSIGRTVQIYKSCMVATRRKMS